jgi:tyrosyl-tRNA synthetase
MKTAARGLSIDEQLDILRRGTARLISEDELRDKLEEAEAEDRPLRVKLGLDPSAPDIHLGHTVVLRKMREFQDLGHEVVLIVGDFTGRIGDPSGKSETRNQLSEEEVKANAQTYAEQAFRVLDPEHTIIEYNSSWLGALTFAEVLELAAKLTVARMLERDDFSARYRNEKPIYVHEFFYPLMQGYDSVALEADIELGGTDQTFNLVMAREIQREYEQDPEVAIIMPILPGTDGVQKMSKSLDNYIGVDEPAEEMFGKTMSIPDNVITQYFELLTDVEPAEVASMSREMEKGELNPRDAKLRLAREIVTLYHSEEAAKEAEAEFLKVFARGSLPTDIPVKELSRSQLMDGKIWIARLINELDMADSNSQARRLIDQGAVRIDGNRVTDVGLELEPADGMVLRVGKRRIAEVRVID